MCNLHSLQPTKPIRRALGSLFIKNGQHAFTFQIELLTLRNISRINHQRGLDDGKNVLHKMAEIAVAALSRPSLKMNIGDMNKNKWLLHLRSEKCEKESGIIAGNR